MLAKAKLQYLYRYVGCSYSVLSISRSRNSVGVCWGLIGLCYADNHRLSWYMKYNISLLQISWKINCMPDKCINA
jgi:Na+(H+)/acetate symporter ActP